MDTQGVHAMSFKIAERSVGFFFAKHFILVLALAAAGLIAFSYNGFRLLLPREPVPIAPFAGMGLMLCLVSLPAVAGIGLRVIVENRRAAEQASRAARSFLELIAFSQYSTVGLVLIGIQLLVR